MTVSCAKIIHYVGNPYSSEVKMSFIYYRSKQNTIELRKELPLASRQCSLIG